MSGVKKAGFILCLLFGVLLHDTMVATNPVLIAAAISAGATIVGTTLSALIARVNVGRTCGIEIENWTRFRLTHGHIELNGGVSETRQLFSIAAATKEAMIFRKTTGTATGTSGTVSWRIDGTGKRLDIMWSVPFDYNLYSNWLAVGVNGRGNTRPTDRLFDVMYEGSSGRTFTRAEYSDSQEQIIYEDDQFSVVGTMGTGGSSAVLIQLRPKHYWDYAPRLRRFLR